MAVSKIIVIRSRLDRCLAYIRNPDKTTLSLELDNAATPGQSETICLETAFNCQLQTAYAEMVETKARWGKEVIDHVQGYHIIQSFSPGEVTPEQAHAIGTEFVRRYLAGQYEAVVTTHLDQDHLHNHILFNSVSLLDGHMYRNNFTDYFRDIRGVTDKLCKENGLSIVEPKGHGKSYIEWKDENDGKPTLRGMVKADVDTAIRQAYTLSAFVDALRKQGYAVKTEGKYMAVRPPGGSRYIRLKSLGEDYTEEAIWRRISEQREAPASRQAGEKKPTMGGKGTSRQIGGKSPAAFRLPSRLPYRGPFAQRRRLTGFPALYFRYLYLLKRIHQNQAPPQIAAPLRQEVIKLRRYIRQYQYIRQHHITTVAELAAKREELQAQVAELTAQRKPLYKEIRRTDGAEAQSTREEIRTLTGKLRTARWELSICEAIEEDTSAIRQNLSQTTSIHESKKEAYRYEYRR